MDLNSVLRVAILEQWRNVNKIIRTFNFGDIMIRIEETVYNDKLRKLAAQMKASKQVTSGELARLEKLVQSHLAEMKWDDRLPPLASFSDPSSSQIIINLVRDLADEAIEARQQAHTELESIEGKLVNEKCDISDGISRLQRTINRKEQKLQELQTMISREELKLKDEKRQFLLSTKAKRTQLERLMRRNKLSAEIR